MQADELTPEWEMSVPIAGTDFGALPLLERARIACNTIKAITAGSSSEPTDNEITEGRFLFKTVTAPNAKLAANNLMLAPTGALLHLDRMLSEYDRELVNSSLRIREYVKNRLLEETENPDGKIRIRALELLGKIKDVGLFTDRIEITHKTKTDEELVHELNQKLERFMGDALEVTDGEDTADAVDVVDAPLGAAGGEDREGSEEDDLLEEPSVARRKNFIASLAKNG